MMSESESRSSQESVETRRDYVSVRVQILAAVFNRNVSDELLRVFKDALERFPTRVMSQAFTKAEQQLEKFPSPKLMQAICGECLPSNAWMYDYKEKESSDPETGKPVKVLIDPVNGDVLFRPQDCPEGRAFLAKLRQVSGKG